MSSNTVEWGTPKKLFEELDAIYHFTLDVCATDNNAKCERYFTKELDGLTQDWSNDICYMNPPYGREIGLWTQKAYDESLRGATVVCLVPARTDTRWWHDTVMKVYPDGVTFIKGRLKFNDGKQSAPFPSALVVFKPNSRL